MSKSPLVVTLFVCGTLLGWVYVSRDGEGENTSPAGTRAPARVYGFPDPRGIVLEIREYRAGACAAARFRSESPAFVLWDDGTSAYRNSTYDYKRGKVQTRRAEGWLRAMRTHVTSLASSSCKDFLESREDFGRTHVSARDAKGVVTLEVNGLSRLAGAHADGCASCRDLRPLAGMIEDISRCPAEQDKVLTGLPVEVHLAFRSCGCRNHPDIVRASREWPLPGPRPFELCGKSFARIRLEDPKQIRALGETIERSAAVLDREEIYTCFMRPLLEPAKREVGPLARR